MKAYNGKAQLRSSRITRNLKYQIGIESYLHQRSVSTVKVCVFSYYHYRVSAENIQKRKTKSFIWNAAGITHSNNKKKTRITNENTTKSVLTT